VSDKERATLAELSSALGLKPGSETAGATKA
jgi:hypothetical protein